jgi:hypothetical protein
VEYGELRGLVNIFAQESRLADDGIAWMISRWGWEGRVIYSSVKNLRSEGGIMLMRVEFMYSLEIDDISSIQVQKIEDKV